MADGDVIEGLRAAIQLMLGCDSRWIQSVQIFASSTGRTWAGTVEVFSLLRHDGAERAYAWREHEGSADRVVLHAHPIDGPLAAVRAMEFPPTT